MVRIQQRAGMLLAGMIASVGMVAVLTTSAEAAPGIRVAEPASGSAVARASTGEEEVRDRGEAELAPNCQRTRRKLFVESEGWIVRRVTICY
jgi:hypothetical protein